MYQSLNIHVHKRYILHLLKTLYLNHTTTAVVLSIVPRRSASSTKYLAICAWRLCILARIFLRSVDLRSFEPLKICSSCPCVFMPNHTLFTKSTASCDSNTSHNPSQACFTTTRKRVRTQTRSNFNAQTGNGQEHAMNRIN